MLNYSKKYPLVFFHLPKNAGKSICEALGIDKEFHPPHLNQTVLLGDDIRESYTDEQWNTLTKFTIIRNPWDRLVSLYHFRKKERDLLIRLGHKGLWHPDGGDKSQEGWDFKRWLFTPETAGVEDYGVFLAYKDLIKINPANKNFFRSSIDYVNQIDLITDPENNLYVDYMLRFENLDEELDKMFAELDLERPELPRNNTSSHKHYREYYDDDTKHFVEQLFAKDIEYFNYTF